MVQIRGLPPNSLIDITLPPNAKRLGVSTGLAVTAHISDTAHAPIVISSMGPSHWPIMSGVCTPHLDAPNGASELCDALLRTDGYVPMGVHAHT